MMPLWTTATSPDWDKCGWLFSSEGSPWVAQRVWPMPTLPESGVLSSFRRRQSSLPRALTTSISPPRSTATPAES